MNIWTRSGAPASTEPLRSPSPFLWAILFFSFLIALSSPSHADLLAEETPVFSPEDQRLFDRTLLDAQRGDPAAMGDLGLLYEKGQGCRKNLDKAFSWLKKGAQKGDAASENNLGFLYFRGIGVKEDGGEAYRWFKKAADQGLASAQSNLGLLFARGGGVPKDLSIAFGWFQKAAEQDDLDAEVNLAQMFSLGEGCTKDLVLSYQWFLIALDHEELEGGRKEELRDDLAWLEKHMTGDQVAKAKAAFRSWVKDHSDPEGH